MKDTLKNLLKPPFECNDSGAVLNKDGTVVIELFGDDFIALAAFVTAAINEKWERDFGGQEEKPAGFPKEREGC